MKNKEYPLYELPHISSLKEMVSLKARETPEGTAFTFYEGKRLCTKTYREVYEDMIGLGTWMEGEGIREKYIGILGENSYEWVLVFLTVINGGNVAVLLDKELSETEVGRFAAQADVEIVFCSEAYMDLTEHLQTVKVICLSEICGLTESGREAVDRGEGKFSDFVPQTEDLACIFFTSGTTGMHKGVMLSHGNLAAEVTNTCRLFKPEGSVIAFLPFHHGFGLVIGLMMFHYGCNLYINKSLKNVEKALLEARPRTLFVVPMFVETFYKQVWNTARKEGKEKILKALMKVSDGLLRLGIDVRFWWFSSVRKAFGGNLEYIISGGAALDTSYVRAFRSWGIEVLNGYGTTECSPCTAVNRNFYHRDGTVGLPIPGSQIRIGEDGEVFVAGPHVMMGYYKEEEETKKVLKNGWYATGDLGFLDKDGFLTLTGRKKNLIILSNGENVSPEELEEQFRMDSKVREVVVYEEEGLIVAEIFPEEGYLGNQEYFTELMGKVNRGHPVYKQVARVKIRDTEFEKNTSMKIIRKNSKGQEGGER